MSKFIEVTQNNESVILNIDWVFAVERHTEGCLIKVGAGGYRDNPFQYYYVSESYEEAKSLIFGSVHNIAE
ncbi:hypothetical protein [Dysgonomonas mossii]|uniref:hypothetical protein n=1 Tax=Dysgonomonas mossii TaxID=163665 RepID=UPI003991A628